jgi:hypothetical protein
LTGADSSLRQWVAIPADNRLLVGTYQIYVFIPATDVTGAPGQSLSTTNTLTNFDPTSANFGTGNETTTDNAVSKTFTPLTGTFGNAYVKDHNNGNAITVGTEVTLGGRVMLAGGRGLFGARMMLVDPLGVVHFAITNPFGYYRFSAIPTGSTVTVMVTAKDTTFNTGARVVSVIQNDSEINFVAN